MTSNAGPKIGSIKEVVGAFDLFGIWPAGRSWTEDVMAIEVRIYQICRFLERDLGYPVDVMVTMRAVPGSTFEASLLSVHGVRLAEASTDQIDEMLREMKADAYMISIPFLDGIDGCLVFYSGMGRQRHAAFVTADRWIQVDPNELESQIFFGLGGVEERGYGVVGEA